MNGEDIRTGKRGGCGWEREREKVNEENTAIILILLRLNVMHFYREKKSFSIRENERMCIIYLGRNRDVKYKYLKVLLKKSKIQVQKKIKKHVRL